MSMKYKEQFSISAAKRTSETKKFNKSSMTMCRQRLNTTFSVLVCWNYHNF